MRLRFLSPHFSSRRGQPAWLWFSLLTFGSAHARAQTPREATTFFTFGNSACPEPEAVEREVRRLIPNERQKVLESGVRIELQDLGESYRVTVSKDHSTVKKSYADAARDCDGRARFAAVFAVLTIMPPELEANEPESEPEPAKPAPEQPPPPPIVSMPLPLQPARALPPLARVELAGLFVAAPAIQSAPANASFGGQLGVAIGRGAFESTLSVGYVTRAHFTLAGVHGDVATLPASVGVRLSTDFGAFAFGADVGFLALLEQVRARNLVRSNRDNTLDFGARAAFILALPVGPRFAPFLGAFTWIVPAPHELRALPQGVIGNLPDWWLGGTAGVSLGL